MKRIKWFFAQLYERIVDFIIWNVPPTVWVIAVSAATSFIVSSVVKVLVTTAVQ